MKHFIELTPEQYSELDTPFLTIMKSTYSAGDELVVTVEGHREQAILTITRVIKEKVNGKYCYLCLSGINDIPASVGGGPSGAAPLPGKEMLHY